MNDYDACDDQLRANIRNCMVPMTCAEARDYAAGLDHAESRKYAEEFVCELEEEFDDREGW